MNPQTVELGPSGTTLADVVAVARRGAAVRLTPAALAAIEQSRKAVEELASAATPVYGVSTGFGARKLRTALANLRRILAIELVVAARATELRAPLRPAPATAAVIAALRDSVPGMGQDRFLSPELEAAERLVASGAVLRAAASVAGDLE